jgi:hypothetical protein
MRCARCGGFLRGNGATPRTTRKEGAMPEDEIRIRFELTNAGGHYVQGSQFEIFYDSGESEIDRIGEQLDMFLKQVGYVRKNDLIFMEDVSEEEHEALAGYLRSLRGG